MLELQIQEIVHRINSRSDRVFELVTDNNLENDAYFVMVKRVGMIKEEQDLHNRMAWRDKRILELELENEFDTLALDTLRRRWIACRTFDASPKAGNSISISRETRKWSTSTSGQ